jgi:hypothetical protein
MVPPGVINVPMFCFTAPVYREIPRSGVFFE